VMTMMERGKEGYEADNVCLNLIKAL